MTVLKILFRIPWHLLFLAGILVLVGSLALYSASQGSWQPWAGRHVVRAIFGMVIVVYNSMCRIAIIDYFIKGRSEDSYLFGKVFQFIFIFLFLFILFFITNNNDRGSRCHFFATFCHILFMLHGFNVFVPVVFFRRVIVTKRTGFKYISFCHFLPLFG